MEDETDSTRGQDREAAGDPKDGGTSHDDPDAQPTRSATWSDVVESADLAFLLGGDRHRIASRLQSIFQNQNLDGTDPLLIPLRRSLNFFLSARLHDRADIDLSPVGLHDDRKWSIKSVPQSDVEAWRKIADEVEHPAARAHFYDLLFKRGGPDAVCHASAAVASYMEVARADRYTVPTEKEDEEREFRWNAHSRNLAMGRALSLRHVIAKGPASAHLVEDSQALALNRIRRILDDTSPHIGDLLLLVRLLTRSRRTLTAAQAESLKWLIEAALEEHKTRDDVVDGLVSQLVLLEPSRSPELNRLRVQVRLDLAASHPKGHLRMIHLERAAAVARDHQFRDLHDDAVRQMQRISSADLGFQSFSAEGALAAEVVAAEIVRASDGTTWREALTSWLQTGSPSGNAEANRRGAADIARSSLVSQLGMPTVIYGKDGLPRWTAANETERRAHELARHEMMSIHFSGLILAKALDAIARTYGIPEVDELSLFLAHEGEGDFELASAFARALLRFWAGDFEGALLTSALRIEAGARRLALALDEAAYVTSRKSAPGVYIGIAALADLLEKHGLDEDWKRYLLTYFVSPEGRSLRHDLAHGFGLDEPEPRIEATLSLRALGLFVYAAWQPGKETAPATPALGMHATGLVEAVGLLVRHVRRGVPLRALLRHEAASLAQLAGRRRR